MTVRYVLPPHHDRTSSWLRVRTSRHVTIASSLCCLLLLWLTIELCWNIYPSTPASSLSLLLTHLSLLLALWMAPPRLPFGADEQSWQGQGGEGKVEGGAMGEMEGMGKEEREAMWQQYVEQMTREAEAAAAAEAAAEGTKGAEGSGAGAGGDGKGAEGEKRKAE
ncbi:unnamed protein product [Closterium sp. NIES-54]